MTVRFIPEIVIPGKRLGRHVRHDDRSLAFAIPESDVVVSVQWARVIPVLDQGDVGSCTGNACTGILGTMPDDGDLAAEFAAGLVLDEAEALTLYSAAEVIDGDGPYPPNDNGSSGLSVAQAAKNAGLCSGYLHALSIPAAHSAIQAGPFMVGSDWYDSFDTPTSPGSCRSLRGQLSAAGTSTSASATTRQATFGTSSTPGAPRMASMGTSTTRRPLLPLCSLVRGTSPPWCR